MNDAPPKGGEAGPPDAGAGLTSGVAFVTRQPIFDRERRLVGYELLYRAHAESVRADGDDALHMTGSTLVNSVLGIGLNQLTGTKPAWVNFPRELLINHDFEILDPRRCIIELLESIDCDEQSVAACEALRSRGFTVALDDFARGDEYDPLVKLAHVVKVRVEGASPESLEAIVNRLQPFGVRFLAEHVETREMFDTCRRLGFSYFQGYHFSRPEIVERRALPVEVVLIARLMTLAVNLNISDRDIEREMRRDPGLSFKLLRMVNAAATGGCGIDSILHAVRLVGRSSLHRWLALLFVSSTPSQSDVDRELILLTLERGRFCELIGLESGFRAAAPSLFLAGLLSSFDTVLGVPMQSLLEEVGVSDDVKAALLGQDGPYTPYLRLATAYTEGDWDSVIEVGRELDIVRQLPVLYGSAGLWARGEISRN